ncbi:MAG: hypothetical protein Q9163_005598 [Psora crenata]
MTADLGTFAEWLVDVFNSRTRGEFVMHSDIDGECDGEGEAIGWSITDDTTLELSRTSNQWAVELVSPILRYGDLSWRAELQAMLESIKDCCSFATNRCCGTHVHISPGVGLTWSLGKLKNIAIAILHFEKAWNVTIPVARRYNARAYAKSNRFDNPKLAIKTDTQCTEAVNACESSVAIADLMNNDGDRYFGWNFTNLYHGGKMTVEFRRGPGVQDFGTCEAWVALAVAFVQATRRAEDVIGFSANVEGLRAFIHEGFEEIGEQGEGIDGCSMERPVPSRHLRSVS